MPEKLAYILGDYPKVSQSFIRDEITAVEEAGPEILRIALNRPDEIPVESAEREEVSRTFYVKAQPPPRVILALVKALAASPRAFAEVLVMAVRAGGTDLRRNFWGLFYFVEALIVWDHCRQASINRLHAHFAHPVANVAWLAAAFGSKTDPNDPWQWSVTIHGPHDFYLEPLLDLEVKARSAAAIICISDFGRAQVLRMISPEYWPKVVVRRCGIDVARFPFRDFRPVSATPRILSVGRLAPEKGQALLVEAIALLTARGLDVEAELIGDGPARAELERTAAAAGLTQRIHWLGELPPADVASHLAEADVFCLPSFGEGIPISIMEAMAVGVPVVCTNVGGVPELVRDGITGAVVAPGRADLLAAAIERLLTDTAYRTAVVKAGRAAVTDQHDLRTNASRLIPLWFAPLAPGRVVL